MTTQSLRRHSLRLASRKYRVETLCYGPKSCGFYKPRPKRMVPGRRGTKHVEEDRVDEEDVAHRALTTEVPG